VGPITNVTSCLAHTDDLDT